MRFSEQIKPISYLKDNTARVVNEITQSREPMIDSTNKLIFIHIVCDQKRDLQTLLIHRLLNMSALHQPVFAPPPTTM